MRVVNFIPWPFYPLVKECGCAAQAVSLCEHEKSLLRLLKVEPQPVAEPNEPPRAPTKMREKPQNLKFETLTTDAINLSQRRPDILRIMISQQLS